jgi:hypothetical protein
LELGREKTQRRKSAKAQRINPSVDPTGFTDRPVLPKKTKKDEKGRTAAFEVERFSPEDSNRE